VKKRIYELIIDYMKLRRQEVSNYLKQIKDSCMLSFIGDPNSLVKEAALQVLVKVIESFNKKEIEVIVKPEELMIKLLDELKLRQNSGSVKGALWMLIGLLHASYPHAV